MKYDCRLWFCFRLDNWCYTYVCLYALGIWKTIKKGKTKMSTQGWTQEKFKAAFIGFVMILVGGFIVMIYEYTVIADRVEAINTICKESVAPTGNQKMIDLCFEKGVVP